MKKITLVKRAISAPNPISYGVEIEVIGAEDINKEIFVKQRINKPDNKFDDVFVAVATPAQLQDLDVNSPAADSSYFRVSKVTLVGTHASFVEDLVRTVLAEIQLLVDNEEALTLLEDEVIYVVTADNVSSSLVPVSLASSSGEYKSATLDTPTGADNQTLFYTVREITIKQVISILTGTQNPSVSWTLRSAVNRNASGVEVKNGGFVTSNVDLPVVHTVFDNPVIPANSFIWINTSGVVGNPTSLNLTMIFQ